MLTLFEEQTTPLSDYELTLVQGFVKSFLNKKGADNAITNKQIVEAYKNKGININDARVRKIINYIRNNNLVMGLMASSKGYYVTTDKDEIKQYIDSLIGRAKAISCIAEKMKDYYNTL